MNIFRAASKTRKRATRACDQCRKAKSRCENIMGQSDEPCRNCLASEAECTYVQPCHKRGPPKGYLSALEQRLHDAEGLLGAIISSSDSRAVTLVSDLSKDPLAKSIIASVARSSLGPIGRSGARPNVSNSRQHTADLREQLLKDQEATFLDDDGHLVFTTPSNEWQEYLNLRVSLEVDSRDQASSNSTRTVSPRPLPPLLHSNDAVPCSLFLDTAVPSTHSTTVKVDMYAPSGTPWDAGGDRDSHDASGSEGTSVQGHTSLATVLGSTRDECTKFLLETSCNNLIHSSGLDCDLASMRKLSPDISHSTLGSSVSPVIGPIQIQRAEKCGERFPLSSAVEA